MSFVLCADFSIFPDDLQLGPVFTLSGMDFQDNPGGGVSIVNQSSGVTGLQFPDVGIEIRLPTTVQWAGMQVGQFASPFTIEAVDPNGNVMNTFAYNKPNSYWFANHSFTDLATLRFLGGGGEGVIVSLCILIP
jgi:hypothetical protein